MNQIIFLNWASGILFVLFLIFTLIQIILHWNHIKRMRDLTNKILQISLMHESKDSLTKTLHGQGFEIEDIEEAFETLENPFKKQSSKQKSSKPKNQTKK